MMPYLTPREKQTLDLAMEGLTIREIGQRMGNAERTIKKYMSLICKKFEVTGKRNLRLRLLRKILKKPAELCTSKAELKQKEIDIIRWAAGGLTRAEIGKHVGYTGNTVGYKLTVIYETLGLNTRQELQDWAISHLENVPEIEGIEVGFCEGLS